MRFFLSFVEQAMGALLTFMINMWMAREGLPAAYGVYAFWLTIAWIMGTAQSTLVTSHLVSLQHKEESERIQFERFFLTIQVVFITCVTLIVAFSNIILQSMNSNFSSSGALLFIPGFLLFQYARSFAFSRLRATVATSLTGGILCFTAILILCFHILGGTPTPSNGLCVAGSAYAIVSLGVLIYLMGKNCIPLSIEHTKPYLPVLHSSGWILLGAGSSELTNRLFSFVTAWHYGASALAVLSATQITLRPAWMLSAAWSSAELPRLSRMWHEQNWRKFSLFIILGAIFPVIGCLIWISAVWCGWTPLTQALYRGHYKDAGDLVLFWGGNVILGSIISSFSCGFLASRRFKALAVTDVAGAIVATIVIFSITPFLPFQYIILGTIAGQVAQALGLAVGLYFLLIKARSFNV